MKINNNTSCNAYYLSSSYLFTKSCTKFWRYFLAGGLLSYFRNLLGSREMRILILGLDGAGKTTILYRYAYRLTSVTGCHFCLWCIFYRSNWPRSKLSLYQNFDKFFYMFYILSIICYKLVMLILLWILYVLYTLLISKCNTYCMIKIVCLL